MIARTIKPVLPLSKFVDSIYCYFGTTSGMRHHLIPDGKTDLLLNFGSAIQVLDESDKKSALKESIFHGLRKKQYTFEFGENLGIIGIRFLPLGFSSLFKYREKEITEKPVSAELIAGKSVREIEEKLYDEPSLRKKLSIVEKWLLDIFINSDRINRKISDSLEELNFSRGLLKINEIGKSDAAYKKLQRTFNEYIGISPKLYSRMLRFDCIHNELRKSDGVDWMDIVAKYNFHDQSHLIKEFKFFTNITPTEFLSNIDIFV
ncbi:MAG: DUF6597 domain-containing transcriptional factor [Ignavibacteria bacterium]